MNRAQTGLPALAIALLVLTVLTGLGLAIADGALASADRNADERRVASSLAERFVAAESPLTERANVLNATRLRRLDASGVERSFPVADGRSFRLRANGTTVATTDDVEDGTTFRRLVVAERQQTRTLRPDLRPNRAITLPRRTTKATVDLSPPANTTLTTVRANDRVLLRNTSGLSGRFEVALSRFETTRLRFEGAGSLPEGSVTITYRAPETTKTTLVVTVDG
ncbi:hypothetical protein SAMN05216559_0860 [Halomicrobium zhouii]|uniref:Uncharacterized protein n=1 Tax=Halomicrobium zhouii TaxID=767519 RepID=A0A1I6KI98_9EURY|nr:hypothetical protein [Halomicrobium zhouii]SFR90965.1 hypothetical protein SAMN05216559_0860 [Halomicrobium zhouii]